MLTPTVASFSLDHIVVGHDESDWVGENGSSLGVAGLDDQLVLPVGLEASQGHVGVRSVNLGRPAIIKNGMS